MDIIGQQTKEALAREVTHTMMRIGSLSSVSATGADEFILMLLRPSFSHLRQLKKKNRLSSSFAYFLWSRNDDVYEFFFPGFVVRNHHTSNVFDVFFFF